jgi:hypothetical protein
LSAARDDRGKNCSGGVLFVDRPDDAVMQDDIGRLLRGMSGNEREQEKNKE